ncbi:MAG: tetratricopeptide repeat protein [Planctomycetes bacterium]|nr:tetratricopeptide repeat protein [Planctomycetota bacterium]
MIIRKPLMGVFVALLILIASVSAQAPDAAAVQAEFQRAVQLFQRGLYWGAESSFRKVVGRQPQLAAAQFGVAMCLYHTSRHEESLGFFAAAGDLPKPQAQYFSFHADALDWLSRTDEAKRQLERALAIEPASSHALFLRGRLAAREGRFDDARKDLIAAVAANPQSMDCQHELASAELRAGELDAAQKRCDAIFAVDPDHTKTHYLMMTLARRRGDLPAAKQHQQTWQRLARADEIKSLRDLKVNGLMALSFGHLERRELSQAVDYLAQVLELDPSNREARETLAGLVRVLETAGPAGQESLARVRSLLESR